MSSRFERLLFLIGLAAVFATAFFIAAFPVRNDSDVWWHLKTGKWLLENEIFPEHDVFTYAGEESEWANHEWLSDILMFLVYERAGLPGIVVVKAVLLGLAFVLIAWLAWRRSRNAALALLLAVIGAVASRYSIHPRPPIITYLILPIFLHLAWNLRQGIRPRIALAAMFLLTVLWINLHGGGILAIAVTGLLFLGSLGDWLWDRRCRSDGAAALLHRRQAMRFLVCGMAVTAATLLNPFGIHIHLLTAKVMGDAGLVNAIYELQTPNMHFVKGYEALIIGMILLLGIRRTRFPLADLFLLVFFFQQSINHVRHVPVFSLISIPILASVGGDLLRGRAESDGVRSPGRSGGGFWLQIGLYAAFLALCLVQMKRGMLQNWFQLRTFPDGFDPSSYPSAATDFVLAHELPGRMYNEINYAGYLIWRLSPEYTRVFTDSRFDIYGSQYQKQSDAIRDAMLGDILPPGVQSWPASDWKSAILGFIQERGRFRVENRPGPPLWRFLLKRWDANYLLIKADSRLFAALHGGDSDWSPPRFDPEGYPRWREVYYDGDFAVYLRDVPANAAVFDRLPR